MTFAELRLVEPIVRSVAAEGYTAPTPIQEQAIPHVLAGRDLLGCAQTGTGKTAAFALPILQRLSRQAHPPARALRALILSPTRELAAQIGDSFRAYGRHTGLRHTVIFGGVGQEPQVRSIRNGTDILVATPGRLLDLMNQGHIHLNSIEVFVLDEADRMLDMGFIHDIRRIVAQLPAKRQTLLFSATMPQEIRRLAGTLLNNPVEVRVAPPSAPADTVEQLVYLVAKPDKPSLLRHLLQTTSMPRTLVFTRTKHGADKVVKQLRAAGLPAEAIHGNKKQNARTRALQSFKSDRPPVLVATDIASRGIDVDAVSHVVNYDIPNEPETYVHRIGRTGRAGACGTAFSFCCAEERDWLKAIERLIRRPIQVCDSVVAPALSPAPRPQTPAPAPHPDGARPIRHHRSAVPATGGTPSPSSKHTNSPGRPHPRPGRGASPKRFHHPRTQGKHRRF